MIRIVKLEFQPDQADHFLSIFLRYQAAIQAQPGCKSVEAFRDLNNSNIFFTKSEWESENALNAYRKSDLFGEIWPQVKPLFSKKAEAWSLNAC